MKALPLIAGVLVVATLTSCDIGTSSHPSDTLSNALSGFAMPGFNFRSAVVAFNGQVFFLTSEADQGSTDLNADGDASDNVVHWLNPATAVVVNLAVSARRPLVATTTRVVWSVSEADEGAVDLNGDGDIGDQVLASFDPALPVGPGNPAISTASIDAFSPIATWGERIVYLASEFDTGTDLNSDGDQDDFVVQVFDAVTGTVVFNTSLAWDSSVPTLTAEHRLAVWLVSESQQGGSGSDLNGDGDTQDSVVYGLNLNTLAMFPVGGNPGLGRAVASSPRIIGSMASPFIAYAIDEASENIGSFSGNALLGDTDTSDFIMALYSTNTGTETLPHAGIAIDPFQVTGSDTRCAFVVSEAANAGGSFVDFNTDGDEADEVPFWVDLAAPGAAYSLGVASPGGAAILELCGEYIVFAGSEADQGASGTNHNALWGDTDIDDDVGFYADLSAVGLPTVNTGWALVDIACFPNQFFLFIPEQAQADTDLTGDEDTDDVVLGFWRPMGATAVMGEDIISTDGNIVFQVCPSVIRIYANLSEARGFGDLNNDGDEEDFIMTVTSLSAVSGQVYTSTPMSTMDKDGSSFALVVDGNTTVFPFAEEMVYTGFDANGDSDAADTILSWIRTNCY